jgi:hypothetical protein
MGDLTPVHNNRAAASIKLQGNCKRMLENLRYQVWVREPIILVSLRRKVLREASDDLSREACRNLLLILLNTQNTPNVCSLLPASSRELISI